MILKTFFLLIESDITHFSNCQIIATIEKVSRQFTKSHVARIALSNNVKKKEKKIGFNN